MKYIVSFGWIFWVVILFAYTFWIGICLVTGRERKRRTTLRNYAILFSLTAAFLLICAFVPRFSNNDYLLDGTSTWSSHTITDSQFKVSFWKAKKGYGSKINLSEEDLNHVAARCSADSGQVYLEVTQGSTEKRIDITNIDDTLELSEFKPGDITFTLKNKDAENVSFELIWQNGSDIK